MKPLSLGLALAACGGSAVHPGDPVVDAAATADAPPASLLGHPFGTHTPYAPGTQLPDHPQAELDAATTAFYAQWKMMYLVAGCTTGEYRVKTMPATTTEFTVSEGHGYGMLIAALMAGADPDAQQIFDGLYMIDSAARVADRAVGRDRRARARRVLRRLAQAARDDRRIEQLVGAVIRS